MFNIDKKKFGAFVAALRKEKGITQKELSEQLCISDKAVSKWETGVSLPDKNACTIPKNLLCRNPKRTHPVALPTLCRHPKQSLIRSLP